MKHGRFILMILLSTAMVFIACDDDGGDNTPKTYDIGDTGPSGVGIVFHVTDGGLHGLEVAPVDQSAAVWSNVEATLAGAAGTATGTGSANTDTIIDQAGHTASAAQICRDYRASEEGDWFLPSRDELNAIWNNLVDDGTGANSGVGGFVANYYWSSSENGATFAWCQDFLNGNQYNDFDKGYTQCVRAVRAF